MRSLLHQVVYGHCRLTLPNTLPPPPSFPPPSPKFCCANKLPFPPQCLFAAVSYEIRVEKGTFVKFQPGCWWWGGGVQGGDTEAHGHITYRDNLWGQSMGIGHRLPIGTTSGDHLWE